MSFNQFKNLKGTYRVVIKSSMTHENMRYVKLSKSLSSKEILLSKTVIKHGKQQLSGPVILFNEKNKKILLHIELYLFQRPLGQLINENLSNLKKKFLRCLTCLGDIKFFCEVTKDSYINKIVFKTLKMKKKIYEFTERGSDEKLLCTNVELDVGALLDSLVDIRISY